MDEQVQEAEVAETGAEQDYSTEDVRTLGVPMSRFNEVNNKYKAFKEFGNPDALRASLARLAKFDSDALIAQQGRDEQLRRVQAGDKEAFEAQYAPARKELSQLYPGLDKLDRLDKVDEILAHQRASNVRAAGSHLESLLKTAGVPVNPETLGVFKSLVDRGLNNPVLAERFNSGDFSVINELVGPSISPTGYLKSLISPERVSPLPRMSNGASSQPVAPPMDLESAHNSAAVVLQRMLAEARG